MTGAERKELLVLYELYDMVLVKPDEGVQLDTLAGCAEALHAHPEAINLLLFVLKLAEEFFRRNPYERELIRP